MIREGDNTQRLVMTALMASLVMLGTVLLRIPVPMTQGYVHLGDAVIYTGVILLGRRNGTIAAALGSVLADVLGGYVMWAPWTLLIKAAMAASAGTFAERTGAGDAGAERYRLITGMALGGLIMCAGYFIAEGIMYGNWPAAMLGIPWNVGQAAVGMAVSLMIVKKILPHM